MRWVCCLSLSGLTVIAATAAMAATPVPTDSDEEAYPAIERFVQVLETVRERHPDADRVAYERLVNHALEGMLAGLDPHSSFIHPEMAATAAEVDPEIPSLGMTLGMRDDGVHVAAVAPLGAAAVAGIPPGCLVLEIDGRKTEGGGIEEILGALHRPAGEKSRLLVQTANEPRPVEVELVHRWLEERSIGEVRMWDEQNQTGYVRLGQFGAGCAREMEAALDELEDKGMKSLVLDLRGNGGGHLGETVTMLGLFLPPGTEVVTTRGRGEEVIESMKTPDRQRRKREYPLTVLIDRMSASASELTAGALQDLKRARVVGETSYGKGSVQNIIPMGGNTALRLTVATYHTPSGKTPHRAGISPDVAVKLDEKDRMNFERRCRIDSLDAEERKAAEAWKDPVLARVAELDGHGR